MMSWWEGFVVLVAYLIGAIPTGYILAKLLKGIDIREHGSCNVGATNVGRVVGKAAGITTLVLDFLKGFIPVLLVRQMIFPKQEILHIAIAIAIIVGHSRSIFLGFTGGKSAISGLGCVIALHPLAGLTIASVAGLVIFISRYVSLGSLTAALFIPIVMLLFDAPLPYVLFSVAAGGFVILRHRENIQRLLRGTENRLS